MAHSLCFEEMGHRFEAGQHNQQLKIQQREEWAIHFDAFRGLIRNNIFCNIYLGFTFARGTTFLPLEAPEAPGHVRLYRHWRVCRHPFSPSS